MKTLLVGKAGKQLNQQVTVDVELRDTDKGLELSICGSHWNHLRTDIYSSGQMLDEIPSIVQVWAMPKRQFLRIREIWQRWHLNSLHAGCDHQRRWGWTAAKNLSEECPACGYKYGSKWLFEPLPLDIIAEVESW